MKPVSIHNDTYNRLNDLRRWLEKKRGGKWTYNEIISRALDVFEKEVGYDGRRGED